MSVVEPCTTEARRKRHLSLSLTADKHAPRRPGRSGQTLCGQGGMDEERANAPRRMYNEDSRLYELVPRTKTITLADLPECLACSRSPRAPGGAS